MPALTSKVVESADTPAKSEDYIRVNGLRLVCLCCCASPVWLQIYKQSLFAGQTLLFRLCMLSEKAMDRYEHYRRFHRGGPPILWNFKSCVERAKHVGQCMVISADCNVGSGALSGSCTLAHVTTLAGIHTKRSPHPPPVQAQCSIYVLFVHFFSASSGTSRLLAIPASCTSRATPVSVHVFAVCLDVLGKFCHWAISVLA